MLEGLTAVLSPATLALICGGTVLGLIVGVLPGLSSTMAVALLLPFTITLEPVPALSLLAALYCAGTFAGSITAILLNAPGAPAAVATALDGYPLAQRGEAGRALGIAAVSSVAGGLASLVVLVLAAPLLVGVAYRFGPPEYFAMAVFGLTMLAALGGSAPAKTLIGGAIGVLLATVGLDPTTGVERFTFGLPALSPGIGFIPLLIGLFAGSELLVQAGRRTVPSPVTAATVCRLPSRADLRRVRPTILRSSALGTFVGILPAEGGTVAAMLGYNEARRWSPRRAHFGTGEIEGIAGPEAANNAATGGAMVPTLALGIPGSATTAVILGALQIQGLRPGPYLFEARPDLLYALFFAMVIANLAFFALALVATGRIARLTLVPRPYLWAAVICLAIMGTYSLHQSMTDVTIMVVAAGAGYLLRQAGFAPAPIVMGLVLGGLMEAAFSQSLILFDRSLAGFAGRPIALTLLLLAGASLLWPLRPRRCRRSGSRGCPDAD